MNDEEFKKYAIKSLMELLEWRLNALEDLKKHNGRLDKEILDTRNDLNRYRKLLEELK